MFKKENYIILCLLINTLFPIGLKALIIPQTASLLSRSGTGVSNSYDVNPALLYNANSHIGFSKNSWFGDLDGQKISILLENKTLLSFETLSVTDIELRDEIASDSPIGFFGVYWYALELNRPIVLKSLHSDYMSIGYKIKLNFSKLYTETMQGYSLDIGLNRKINDKLSFGFAVKNIGEESSNNLRVDNLSTIAFGVSYLILNEKLLLSSDILKRDGYDIIKLAFGTNLPYINFIFGGTHSKDYKDISFGIKVKFNEWTVIYGHLSHDNPSLGNPSSVEIKKYF